MKISQIIIIILCCFFVSACSKEEAEIINYYDLRTNKTLSFDLKNIEFSNGHTVLELFVCPDNSEIICVVGGPTFAVPRKFDPKDTSWKFDKYIFNNRGLEAIKLMGKSYDVYRIELADSGGWLWYLYSMKHGLLAIGSREGNTINTAYILQNLCGLGASTRC